MDISILKPYIKSVKDIAVYSQECAAINVCGFDDWFNSHVDLFTDCSRSCKDVNGFHRRVLQTNEPKYKDQITIAVKLLEHFITDEDSKEYYYNKLINRHNANLEYEAVHGFEYNPNDLNTAIKAKVKSKTKTKKEPKLFDDIPVKVNKKENKLKGITFKLSIANE